LLKKGFGKHPVANISVNVFGKALSLFTPLNDNKIRNFMGGGSY
jgi:hypothetical protein